MFSFKQVSIVVLVAGLFYLVLNRKEKLNPDDVKGLRVVVTGGSSGIGEQIAYNVASMGAKVFITARTTSKLKKVVEKCKSLGAQEADFLATSMYSYHNASLVITKALEKFGGIDLLVLNHIGQTYVGGYTYDVAHIEKLLIANTLTHAHMAGISMESLKKSKGRISVVSSIAALDGSAFLVPYTTTKCALEGFFASLRHELVINKTGVSVSINHIGLVDTKAGDMIGPFIPSMKASSPEGCAAEIVRGAMARESEVYYPWFTAIGPIVKGLFPQFYSNNLRDSFQLSAAVHSS